MSIDAQVLTAELKQQLKLLTDDLQVRVTESDELAAVVNREWTSAQESERTALDQGTWQDGLFDQVAVAWLLATTFIRFCEDNDLLPSPVLSGPGERRTRAEAAQNEWFRGTAAGERGYVEHVVGQAAALPGLNYVFDRHSPFWLFGPSEDAVRGLIAYWREVDPDSGALRRDFTDSDLDTRFLGDLYQDLSEHAKKQYALLQTPEFVERFILEHTLGPALAEFGLAGFRMIDPACGSGHFLLGAFDVLVERWRQRAPQDGDRAAADRALQSIYGVDINPAAAAIAKFRLLVAAMQAAGVSLAETGGFTLNVAVGDSLLHSPPGQGALDGIVDHDIKATRHAYATEDKELLREYLGQRYHAVVANPPYITPKDPAANAAYRGLYPEVCHRQYSLAVPFMQRLFHLARPADDLQPAGYVGQITANSFMKREFGKKMIEGYLRHQVNLTYVIDTSGAYIPGHGTPTVILFGRNSKPVGGSVRAVLGVRGEPSRPEDPARGEVWTSIVDLFDQPGTENDYISVADLDRDRLAKHPWSLQGGGAVELKERVEAGVAKGKLAARIDVIGFGGITGEDNIFVVGDNATARRLNLEGVRPLVIGEDLRDWVPAQSDLAIWPYDGDIGLRALEEIPHTGAILWCSRRGLHRRKRFGTPMEDLGIPWWSWRELYSDRLQTPLSITFAFVATHNHFVLDRGGKVFKQSAPVIKLGAEASEEDHLALLGPLNSAVGCFWMKQVFHGKGNGGIGGGITDELWEAFYEFDGTKLKQFPLPQGSALAWARRLDELAQELATNLPDAVVARGTPTREDLDRAQARVDEVRREMVAVQEELDWRCLFLYGVTDEDLSLDPAQVPLIDRGERAFEIVLARELAAGETETTWFGRHGSTPITDLPAHWPDDYRKRVEQRIELIGSDRFVRLAERPEYKRRWNWDDWGELEAEALRDWLLDRLERPDCWPRYEPRSAQELADHLRTDPEFMQVATLAHGLDVDPTNLVSDLVRAEAVPYVAGFRHTAAGMRKRARWEEVWDMQRQEDAGKRDGHDIPVPPKYNQKDFVGAAWKHRGKLDVPKERFVSYPGAEHPNDPTPLVGWAGWDHLEQARALAWLYQDRRYRQGWDDGADRDPDPDGDPDSDGHSHDRDRDRAMPRLEPLLAGLDELVPWLRQWHNHIDDATGERMGDYFAAFVADEARSLGLASGDLKGWQPPQSATRRRTRKRPNP